MALDEIDMTNKEATTFCVSWDTCNVTKYGLIEVAASELPTNSKYVFLSFFLSVSQQCRGKNRRKG